MRIEGFGELWEQSTVCDKPTVVCQSLQVHSPHWDVTDVRTNLKFKEFQ